MAHQLFHQGIRFDHTEIFLANGGANRSKSLVHADISIAILHKLATGHFSVINQHPGSIPRQHFQCSRVGTYHHVTSHYRIRPAVCNSYLVEFGRRAAQADMADDGATLLRKTGKIKYGGALTLQMRCHGD